MTPQPRRRLLVARVVLGTVGVLILVPAIVVALSLGTGGPLDPVGGPVRTAQGAMERTQQVLARVQDSLDAASTTLHEATGSANDTAAMTDALATAMNDLADASSVQVLGIQPFAGLAPRFAELGTRATHLAASLRTTAHSVDDTRSNLDHLTAEVTSLADLVAQQRPGGIAGSGGAGLAVARAVLALLLGWLAVNAALSVVEARAALLGERHA